jgi:hypothetical protein
MIEQDYILSRIKQDLARSYFKQNLARFSDTIF